MNDITKDAELIRSLEIYKNDRLRLGAATCSEIARLTVAECSLEASGDAGEELLSFRPRFRQAAETACIFGEAALKPYTDGENIGIEIIPKTNFAVLKLTPDGTPVDTVFLSAVKKDGHFYEKAERHTITKDGYTITNTVKKDGREGKLSDVDIWSGLSPKVCLAGIKNNLFSILSTPDGKPVYRKGEGLILECNRQFDRLLWEYEGGELAVDASEDAFKMGRDGKLIFPAGKERLFRTNLLDACSSQSELIKTFNPDLRDENYIRGLNRLLMLYEDALGISRGTFSDISVSPKTAAEVEAGKERTLSLVYALREKLFASLGGLYTALWDIFALYRGKSDRESGFTLTFGDGISGGGMKCIFENGKGEIK